MSSMTSGFPYSTYTAALGFIQPIIYDRRLRAASEIVAELPAAGGCSRAVVRAGVLVAGCHAHAGRARRGGGQGLAAAWGGLRRLHYRGGWRLTGQSQHRD